MSNKETIILSEKYKEFLKYNDADVEFLEGTTAAGKTTVGVLKFMFKVASSTKKMHVLSGLDLGTIEKNIINKDLGIVDIFGSSVEYRSSGGNGHTLPHIIYKSPDREKVIYVLGYDNKTRWKKALGSQFGCVYIDEINIANMEYVREISMRCDYLMGTLNPDDPNLPIYKEYINCSRPLPEYEDDAPKEINDMLNSKHKDGWVHWFFDFDDNLGLSKEKKAQIIGNVPIGTKLYKNKIQGVRGRSTGLIFSNFTRQKNIITKEQLKKMMTQKDKPLKFVHYSCGVDTAYSSKSPDTIAFIYQGITNTGQLIILDEEIYNNAELTEPVSPSDVVVKLIAFLNKNKDEWGFARDVFIDSADQATLTELKKYKRNNGSIYNFLNAHKKMKIIDRIHLMIGWLNEVNGNVCYLVLDHCAEHVRELESYSWKEDKYEPEDRNDHTVNASQYGFLPFKARIGNRG